MKSSTDANDQVKVKSLYKALNLLNYFNEKKLEYGISELAQLSGMQKSSIHNIIATMAKCGFIHKNPKTNKYSLGLKLLELSHLLSNDDNSWQIIRTQMTNIAEKTGETVFFATLYGTQIIYREAAFPLHSLSVRGIKGVIAPMYCTGIGKAILAFQDTSFVQWVIEAGFTSFTPNTITDPEKLLQELDLIRKRGYAVDNMEHEYGIACVGVPIRNEEDILIGAMSISGPSPRFTDEKFKDYAFLLLDTARTIKNSFEGRI